MSGVGGKATPEDEASALAGPSAPEDEEMEKMQQRTLKKHSTMHKRDYGNPDRVEVDRSALEAILDVSQRLQDIQRKSKLSQSTLALGHESYKDKQVNKVVD